MDEKFLVDVPGCSDCAPKNTKQGHPRATQEFINRIHERLAKSQGRLVHFDFDANQETTATSANVPDLRELHATAEAKGELKFSGVDEYKQRPKTLEDVAEIDANGEFDKELKTLAGVARKENNFDKINQLLESLEHNLSLAERNMHNIRIEMALLKKLSANK